MPRGRNSSYADNGPSDDDLAAFAQMLGGQLDDRKDFPLADGTLGKLVERCANKGYAMRIAPIDGGRARAVTIYLSDDRKVERRGSDPEAFEEALRELYLAAEKLPRKRS